ncbi:MAG: DNA/RNA nuclease SfsA [Candidatus Anammoxibacter sp.]
MKFESALIRATLIKRYKRFPADVVLATGEIITVHSANTGSMMGCSDPGSIVWLSDSKNPKRKYRYSWEITETSDNVSVGVNTMLSNALVKEAITRNIIEELKGYDSIRSEVSYGKENSRIDILLEKENNSEKCYVEVKNVTAVKDKTALFPDAVSKRGTKHIRELIEMVREGNRGVLCFCVQRNDATAVRPADEIDPEYGKTLRKAINMGMEAIAYRATVSQTKIELKKRLPVITLPVITEY